MTHNLDQPYAHTETASLHLPRGYVEQRCGGPLLEVAEAVVRGRCGGPLLKVHRKLMTGGDDALTHMTVVQQMRRPDDTLPPNRSSVS